MGEAIDDKNRAPLAVDRPRRGGIRKTGLDCRELPRAAGAAPQREHYATSLTSYRHVFLVVLLGRSSNPLGIAETLVAHVSQPVGSPKEGSDDPAEASDRAAGAARTTECVDQ